MSKRFQYAGPTLSAAKKENNYSDTSKVGELVAMVFCPFETGVMNEKVTWCFPNSLSGISMLMGKEAVDDGSMMWQ